MVSLLKTQAGRYLTSLSPITQKHNQDNVRNTYKHTVALAKNNQSSQLGEVYVLPSATFPVSERRTWRPAIAAGSGSSRSSHRWPASGRTGLCKQCGLPAALGRFPVCN